MSTKAHHTFTREFKLELCRQVHSGQKRPAQICREHQLSEEVLLRWRHEYEELFRKEQIDNTLTIPSKS